MRGVSLVAMATLVSVGIGVRGQVLPSPAEGVYTSAQAERGQTLYDARCVSCHGELSAFVPEMAALLADHTFRNRWNGRPLGDLLGRIRDEMPQDAPGTLSSAQAADLVAYILSGNRLPAGDVDLPADMETLRGISFDR